MGCFSTCFDACNPSRRHRQRHRTTLNNYNHIHKKKNNNTSLLHHLENYQSIDDFNVPKLIQQEDGFDKEEEEEGGVDEKDFKGENPIEISTVTIGDDERKEDAKLSGRKKVTFDLNVVFYENSTRDDEEDQEDEEEEEEEEEYDDDGDEMNEEDGIDELGKKKLNTKFGFECECGSDTSSSSLFSYPRNHRYQNCRDSDDDLDEVISSDESDNEEYSDEDDDDGDGDDGVKSAIEEQSSESLFSLSIDSRKHRFGSSAVGGDKEVNSPMPMKNTVSNDSISRGVDSVLNPVENLTQWKDMKARSRIVSKDQAKENLNLKEMAVDTSLSTWLVGSAHGKTERSNSGDSSVSVGNSPSDMKTVSPNKFEDRPILGALTLEEIRLISAASSTPRKSPSRSPADDVPIIGSVGSYWSHTGGQGTKSGGSSGKSTKSRYRESAEVIWDSTPFEARLEKALEKEADAEQVFAVVGETQKV